MRRLMIIALLALAGVTFESVPGHAQGAWCAYYGRGLGGTNCGFYTYRQCMEALSGNGGYCNRNPEFYAERRHYRPRYYNYYRPY